MVANESGAAWKDVRFGSIAAWRSQVDYYWRLATGPWVKSVCEVGFNAGHSAVVWLLANPKLVLYTFDLFDRVATRRALAHLQERFPGRIVPFRGNSLSTVPRAQLPTTCDLVHVDGRHSYDYVIQDLVHMQQHASPRALYIFDDQCNATSCHRRTSDQGMLYSGGPTLAVCDMVRAHMLEPVDTFYDGLRMWATFVAGDMDARRWAATPNAFPNGTKLPTCVKPCSLRWSSAELERRWYNPDRGLGARERKAQRETMGRSCNIPLGPMASPWTASKVPGVGGNQPLHRLDM